MAHALAAVEVELKKHLCFSSEVRMSAAQIPIETVFAKNEGSQRKWAPDPATNPTPHSSYRLLGMLVLVVTFQLQPTCFRHRTMKAHQDRKMI